jgi:hypothetical protein
MVVEAIRRYRGQPGSSPIRPSGRRRAVRDGIVAILAAVAAIVGVTSDPVGAGTPPAAPRMLVDTTSPTQTGKTIGVRAGGDLQAALNSAQLGDVIELEAGASWRGSFRLPNKTSGSGWIIVRSVAHANLPPPGNRVGPQHAPLMARIVAPGVDYALWSEEGAHHYRFVGLEITGEGLPRTGNNNALVALDGAHYSGLSYVRQVRPEQVPHHLVFDRCYVHSGPDTGGEFVRGFIWNSAWTALIDSHVSGFKSRTLDSQAIIGWNGPGPFKIVNNLLEAAGENVMFGGAAADLSNLVPSDIEIRLNDLKKPPSWRPGDPSYAGTPWLTKNLLEFKNGQRALIEGNLFEDHWAGGQSGWFLMLSPRVEAGANPWAVASDITFRFNWVRRTTAGIAASGHDSEARYETSARIAVHDNVFEDLGVYVVPGAFNGVFLMAANGVRDLTVERNTIFNSYTPLLLAGGPAAGLMTGFVFRNNILHGGGYAIVGEEAGNGVAALDAYAPGWVFEDNIIVGPWPNSIGLRPPPAMTPPQFPVKNFFPMSFDDVGFLDRAHANYRLATSGHCRARGKNGFALGADVSELLARRSLPARAGLSTQ